MGFHIGRILRAIAPIAIGVATGNPFIGAAAGAGLGATGPNGSLLGGVTGAATGYFGTSGLNGAISGFQGLPVAGTVGPTAGGISGAFSGAGAGLSSGASALGNVFGISGSTVGTASKVLQAASLGSSLFGSQQQQSALGAQKIGNPDAASTVAAAATPYSPVQPAAMALPGSMSQMASYSPEQTRSALATQGINGGLGSDEQSYYKNLLQRSLIGDGNKVDNSNPNFLLPIESSYWSRQGKNTSSPMQFLQGIST